MLTMRYVKANQTEMSIERVCNDYADVAAKRGLAMRAISDDDLDRHRTLLDKVRQVASWSGSANIAGQLIAG